MADRGLGGAIVSLIAYLVILQGLAGAVSQAAMADPGAAPVGVLCSGGFAPADSKGTDPDGTDSHTGHAACCMALCRAACLTGACLPTDAAGMSANPASDPARPTAEAADIAGPHAIRLQPEARAPPARG